MSCYKGKFVMDEEFENVSIIFIDIFNFDEIIGSENRNIIAILDRIYRFFDSLCVTHGVQKIEVSKFFLFFNFLFEDCWKNIYGSKWIKSYREHPAKKCSKIQ